MDFLPTTQSDCEVIIHLFIRYGIQHTLSLLDGVYSFVLYDNRITDDLNNQIYIARDPFGVRPLYYLKNKNDKYNLKYNGNGLYGFASELKCLEYFYNLSPQYYSIEQFRPGTYSVFNLGSKVGERWEPIVINEAHFVSHFSHTLTIHNFGSLFDYNDIFYKISTYFNAAVVKRCITTERPIACLLSGGLDSSLVAAIAARHLSQKGITLETYSIGLEDSEDLKYAAIVANHIKSKHTQIICTEDDFINSIPQVIKDIESYDTTTVRASVGNWNIGKYARG
jgi:asparagine synthase (glutamine-hydrolysing)